MITINKKDLKPCFREMTASQILGIINNIPVFITKADDNNVGRIAEVSVIEILQNHFKIKDTAKIAGSGDMIISREGTKIMVEVKSYSRKVPTRELEKLCRDLDNSSCDGALLISNQPVVEKINRPNIMIVTTMDPQTIVCAAELLWKKLTLHTQGQWDMFCEKVQEVETVISELSNMIYTIQSIKSNVEKNCNKLYEQVVSTRIQAKLLVRSLDVTPPTTLPTITLPETKSLGPILREKLITILKTNHTTKTVTTGKMWEYHGDSVISIKPMKTKSTLILPIASIDLGILSQPKWIKIDKGLVHITLSGASFKSGILEWIKL
jgi:hypothetical protein